MGSECGIREERFHNKVVKVYSKTFAPDFEVHLNLGEEKNYGIGDHYPDIVAVHKTTGQVHIAEVKTPTYINSKVAEEQWKPFSKIASRFVLLIPEDKTEFVTSLFQRVKGLRVDALVRYSENCSGRLSFAESM